MAEPVALAARGCADCRGKRQWWPFQCKCLQAVTMQLLLDDGRSCQRGTHAAECSPTFCSFAAQLSLAASCRCLVMLPTDKQSQCDRDAVCYFWGQFFVSSCCAAQSAGFTWAKPVIVFFFNADNRHSAHAKAHDSLMSVMQAMPHVRV